MSKTILTDGDEGVQLIVNDDMGAGSGFRRAPVHVVYGGADRYSAETPAKLGRIALSALEEYAPNFTEFAAIFGCTWERMPASAQEVSELEHRFEDAPELLRRECRAAWLALNIHRKTVRKLEIAPVEDFRIDFEDGYGIRSDEEEDADAVKAAGQLAAAVRAGSVTEFSGFRIKSFDPERRGRSTRTLYLFLEELSRRTGGILPNNFVVTLPKVSDKYQVRDLTRALEKVEEELSIPKNTIGIELMVETPDAIFDRKGKVPLRKWVDASDGRCTSVHFGAYDYTAALGISASFQDIRHPACSFARQVMQAALAGTGVRLVDSVTTEMPLPVHRKTEPSEVEVAENRRAVAGGWRKHFDNITASMADGFYQSWDLHPNQLVARYAAVYSFFLSEFDPQAARLRSYVGRATKATLTGNTFDDAASAAGLINFFERGVACSAFDETEVEAATGSTLADMAARFRGPGI